jgi:hypothetical protein
LVICGTLRKQTALPVVEAVKHEEIVRFLIERGAGIVVRNIEGKQPST